MPAVENVAYREAISAAAAAESGGQPDPRSGPRRVVLFTEAFLPKVDGIVNTLCHVLDGLRAQGCRTLVVAPVGSVSAFGATPVLTPRALSFPPYPEVRLGIAGPVLFRELDAFQPELVHLVGPTVMGVSGLVYARTRDLPTVASYHTDLPRYTQYYGVGWLEQPTWRALAAIHNRCALTLCPSRAQLAELRAHGFRRLRYWSRGVDAVGFHPDRASAGWRARLGGEPGAPLLLYVGRLAPEKRLDLLVDVLRAIPAARLALVGDGPDRARLERLFAGLSVYFTGYLRGPALAAAYASADVFVFPSHTETLGNVVLEAMASGLPVVAAGAGGVTDLVEDGRTGVLFPPEDGAAMARQVGRVLTDQRLQVQVLDGGLRFARQRAWPRQLALLFAYYRLALRAHGAARLPAAS
jgi:glycosyltransferase involved in cell wall biosynthesis